ncbi:uncharacterized protein FIESC28_01106 [Fusarium coffeatum]|uniref:Apple domain-containing protein n=1 Tax=Fusarium coffeatum TaxID=231269 RepID=A0A366SAY7_9HYPO|nr:uncharacterized protein FIESC28_01106 [Fusarium coffeatum]RBR26078.1 hypothetical protein FIESC28_01106 [Fusarium coffeatum]
MQLSNRLVAFTALNPSLISSVLASQTCSQLTGRVYTDGPNGRNFEILCNTSTINGNIFAYYSQGDEFQDCVDRCDSNSNCIAALFLDGSSDCALINTYQGTRSFNGNDLAIARPAPAPTTTSAEPSSAEPTTTEAATTEATSSEAPTAETTSVETTSVESSTNEPFSSETTSAGATSTETTAAESSTIDSSRIQSSATEPSSTEPSSTHGTSSETSSIVQDSTMVSTTDSSYTRTATTEASTDDCDDETSSYEPSATSADSTSTGSASDVQPVTSSTQSLTGSTSAPESSEPSTSPYSTIQTIPAASTSVTTTTEASVPSSLSTSVTSQEVSSIPVSSKSTTTQIYAPPDQATSLIGSSSSETKESGSKTLPSSGVTTMKTTAEGRLPTYLPASDCVWSVYLTMVKYVTCSTGVVPETTTTATYVTVDGSAVTYGPPVIQLPSGCIGGYQVDASGHRYPVVQPTMGSQGYPSGEKNHPSVRPTLASPGGSQPSSGNSQYHVPAPTAGSQGPHVPEQGSEKPSVYPTQGSQGSSHDSKGKPPVSGQDSPKSNGGEPHRTLGETAPTVISAYHTGSPAYPSLASSIHQGQHNTSMTFTVKTATAGGVGEHKASSSSSAEAPSTPVIASGSNKHRSMLWASMAGALVALTMLSV